MRILHYILGFPPMRSGGLTHYAIDLMQAQIQLGHEVFAVYPENPSLFFRNIVIREGVEYCDIRSYRIKNALLLPLFHGIKDVNSFMTENDVGLDIFRKFFKQNYFDVLHVHTLMGLPISFLRAAKERGVKIVYTSHDYFGLCSKVNFINQDGCFCEDGADFGRCTKCNASAKSLWYLWLRNSKLLVFLKKILKR